jgi:hypothetical protein
VNRRNAVARLAAVVAGILGVTKVAACVAPPAPPLVEEKWIDEVEPEEEPFAEFVTLYTPDTYDRKAGVWHGRRMRLQDLA